ncbi:tail fiber assembly protein [Fundidesulfovibrio magnetotacticus]|uniref:tail fiber assembly protein n=1 Tax=Fundidesulfovibrio magnetotacticus TaxID=2730080 RepID=UPI0015637C12|nr:tail fiber assembly protein [Fundidesulfovibrio magnetotacticus]
MILYRYDESGLYTGPVSPALSPARPFVNGRPNHLRPARSTEAAPPEAPPGHAAVFDGQAWSLVEDRRGLPVYDKSTRARSLWTRLGPLPEDLTDQTPPSDCHVWDGQAWTEDMALRLARVRRERDRKLAACDWTQLPDVPLAPETRAAWTAYRQALRDHPQDWSADKTWPQPPQE